MPAFLAQVWRPAHAFIAAPVLRVGGRPATSACMNLPLPPAEDYVASPCVSVCVVDQATKSCVGCLRTIKEIGAWRVMTVEEKRAVVAACEERAKTRPRRGRDRKPLSP